MNVCKIKRNSVITTRKIRLNDYANKHDKKIVKNNITRVKEPDSSKVNQKSNNNLYLKSEYNIQKANNEPYSSLAYIKSLPSHIVKKQFFITPTKVEVNKSAINQAEVKTEKNEDSLSTFPLTKESMIITPQKKENLDIIDEDHYHVRKDL